MSENLPPELAKLLRDGLRGSKQAVVRIQLRYGSGRSMLLEAEKKMACWSVTLRFSEERRVHRLCYSGLNLAAKQMSLSSAALARESNAALDLRSKLPIHSLRMSSCYAPNLGLEGVQR
jgi:hypothetical protein